MVRLQLPVIPPQPLTFTVDIDWTGDCTTVRGNTFIAFRLTLHFARFRPEDIGGIRAFGSQELRLRSAVAINLQRQSDNESVSFRLGQTMCQEKRHQPAKSSREGGYKKWHG